MLQQVVPIGSVRQNSTPRGSEVFTHLAFVADLFGFQTSRGHVFLCAFDEPPPVSQRGVPLDSYVRVIEVKISPKPCLEAKPNLLYPPVDVFRLVSDEGCERLCFSNEPLVFHTGDSLERVGKDEMQDGFPLYI